MWVEMLWIPAFAGMTKREMGMTEETDGLDESCPYIYIDRRDACPTVLFRLLRAYAIRPYFSPINSKLVTRKLLTE